MQEYNYNRQAVYSARRKKRRRQIIIKRILFAVITAVVTTALIIAGIGIYSLIAPEKFDEGFIPTPFGKNVSKKVALAKELEIPDWIESQLISFHTTARTGKNLTDINNVVIHYVGNPKTTAQNNRDYFNNKTTTVSSHFVVGLEGEIIQCVPMYEMSAASNDRNRDTISIEVCHPDKSGKYNEDTYNSVVKLTAWICNNFSLDENDVIRHYDITGKICPKYYVENEDAWEQLRNDVREKLEEYED